MARRHRKAGDLTADERRLRKWAQSRKLYLLVQRDPTSWAFYRVDNGFELLTYLPARNAWATTNKKGHCTQEGLLAMIGSMLDHGR